MTPPQVTPLERFHEAVLELLEDRSPAAVVRYLRASAALEPPPPPVIVRVREPVRERRRCPRCEPESPHGSRARYSAGCRCDECRAAQAAYVREQRRRRVAV